MTRPISARCVRRTETRAKPAARATASHLACRTPEGTPRRHPDGADDIGRTITSYLLLRSTHRRIGRAPLSPGLAVDGEGSHRRRRSAVSLPRAVRRADTRFTGSARPGVVWGWVRSDVERGDEVRGRRQTEPLEERQCATPLPMQRPVVIAVLHQFAEPEQLERRFPRPRAADGLGEEKA